MRVPSKPVPHEDPDTHLSVLGLDDSARPRGPKANEHLMRTSALRLLASLTLVAALSCSRDEPASPPDRSASPAPNSEDGDPAANDDAYCRLFAARMHECMPLSAERTPAEEVARCLSGRSAASLLGRWDAEERRATARCLQLPDCDAVAACMTEPTAEPARLARLTVGAASIVVPEGARRMSAADEAGFRARLGPDVELGGLRTREGAVVLLQHILAPRVADGGEVVADALDAALDEQLAMSGMRVGDPRVTRSGDEVRRQCVRMAQPTGVVETMCTFLSYEASGDHAQMDIVRCSGGDEAACAPLFDSYDPGGPRLASSARLAPTDSPGLPEVSADGFAWIRFGMSGPEYDAACQSAGGRVTAPDDTGTPPSFRAAIAEGRVRACAWGDRTSLGMAELVHASFDEAGRLVQAGIWIRADEATLRATLAEAYPDWISEGPLVSYFVGRGAEELETLGITAMRSSARPGTTLVQISTRAAHDRPPF